MVKKKLKIKSKSKSKKQGKILQKKKINSVKNPKSLIKNLFLVFFGGVFLLVGIVMINTDYKLISALIIIFSTIIFLYGFIKLE